jgi:DNA-binding MarR family transcriptional regulator
VWYALHQSLKQLIMVQSLRRELSSTGSSLSSPPPEALATWRVFFECALALPDLLDAELQAGCKLSIRWYDVLVQLEEAGDGVPMTELANRILASKSGLTRGIDRMEEAGLVRRERPRDDRRVVRVFMTPEGAEVLRDAREVHRDGIRRHFAEHLDERDLERLRGMLQKVREHVRPLRPGRISADERARS